jgi:putative hydrolase of the HAD superfamily
MSKNPTVILLDIDDTLYEYSRSHSEGMNRAEHLLLKEIVIRKSEFGSVYDSAKSSVKNLLGHTAASHSRLLYFKRLLEQLGLASRVDLAYQMESAYWVGFIMAMKMEEAALEFLQKARERGVPVILATDLTAGIQIRKVMQLGIHPYIFGMLTSEEIGLDKPAPAFARELQARFQFDFSRAWVVGDDHAKDGGLAEALNCAFWKAPAGSLRRGFFETLTRNLGEI